MKIDVVHRRAFMGNDIQVAVDAGGGPGIDSVEIVLDGITLADESLSPANDSWTKTLPHAGSAGPGEDHTLVVTVQADDGSPHIKTEEWTDVS
jgi:hypothetical protein